MTSYTHAKLMHYGVDLAIARGIDHSEAWLPGFACGWCDQAQAAVVVAAVPDGNYRPTGKWVREVRFGRRLHGM